MIELASHKMIILTPPKCGSNALHAALCNPDWKGVCWAGFDARYGEVGRHILRVPYELILYQTIGIVRNPYGRTVSLYHDYCRVRARYGQSSPSFSDFVTALPDLEPNTPGHWFWNTTLTELYTQTRVDKFVKLETLSGWLYEHGIASPIPRLNESFRGPTAEYYTDPVITNRVLKLYADDFKNYNYTKDMES